MSHPIAENAYTELRRVFLTVWISWNNSKPHVIELGLCGSNNLLRAVKKNVFVFRECAVWGMSDFPSVMCNTFFFLPWAASKNVCVVRNAPTMFAVRRGSTGRGKCNGKTAPLASCNDARPTRRLSWTCSNNAFDFRESFPRDTYATSYARYFNIGSLFIAMFHVFVLLFLRAAPGKLINRIGCAYFELLVNHL